MRFQARLKADEAFSRGQHARFLSATLDSAVEGEQYSRRSRNSGHAGAPADRMFPREAEAVGGNRLPEEHFMRNKLLVSTAVLAAGIAVVSCEKTPSEPGANQSGSATSEAQQNQSAQAQQRGTEEPIKQSQPGEAQQHSSQTAREAPVEEKEQQSKEGSMSRERPRTG
jgi:hypothetical protein